MMEKLTPLNLMKTYCSTLTSFFKMNFRTFPNFYTKFPTNFSSYLLIQIVFHTFRLYRYHRSFQSLNTRLSISNGSYLIGNFFKTFVRMFQIPAAFIVHEFFPALLLFAAQLWVLSSDSVTVNCWVGRKQQNYVKMRSVKRIETSTDETSTSKLI